MKRSHNELLLDIQLLFCFCDDAIKAMKTYSPKNAGGIHARLFILAILIELNNSFYSNLD